MIPKEIRLIDEKGKQLGIFSFQEASQKAQERGLDLVPVTTKTTPPIYKLGDYGKLKYQKEKELKKKKLQERHTAPKSVRLGFNEGEHDLNTKIKKVEKFLKEEKPVTIEMKLRGRQKAHFDLAKEKIEYFCQKITTEHKVIQPLKKVPRGLIIVLKK
ncbi:MAG: translation initiation factor IF-3 [Candidatus Pacebacteria bacterium]|nr:translation initiation factor IF-3 [Candidatus Paceibacterota bacterium]MDD4994401.1 translation initiation factor IF-3 [Candidatus Paceibacterota bacterium]MDD5535106.1 translation initiation factor IF-3 [Candidatus Paceibacterota bacterium]